MAEEKKIDRGEYHKKTAGGGFTALKCSRCGFDIEKGDSADMALDNPDPYAASVL